MADDNSRAALTMVKENTAHEREDVPEIHIRRVVTKDLFTVVKIIMPQLNVPRIREMFSDMRNMSEEERERNQGIFGMEMITMVLGVATDAAVQDWLADMAGMTTAQFLDSPIDTPLRIVQALWADEDIRKIFTTLLQ
jgi:hypothetical protein